MYQDKEDIYKRISITYDSIEELFEREEAMNKTLFNYLQRENRYEFYDSRIEQDSNNKFRLVLEIKLKDEYNS